MTSDERPEGSPAGTAPTDPAGTGTPGTDGTGPAGGATDGTGTAATPTAGDGAPVPAPGPRTTPPTDDGAADGAGPGRFGTPGRPVNRSHPFYVGFWGAIGVLVAYWLLTTLGRLTEVLTLLLVALFVALGLDPVVAWLQRRGLGRGWAVAAVVLGVIAVVAGFAAAVVPTLVTQASDFSSQAPDLLTKFENSGPIRWLDQHYGLISNATDQLKRVVTNKDTLLQVFGGVYGAGKAVISGAFSVFTVLVLTLYILASKQAMTEAAYRLVPASRRDRVRLLGDEIIRRIGAYIAGQVAVASINAALTYVMLAVLGLDYRLVLAIGVGLLGLIPMIGATLGAVLVVLVALFHSWQLAVIALVYYVIYQQVENYVISPRIMARAVAVPGAVTVIAALIGGTLLGMIGALVAIPVAAGILLIIDEVVVPRQAAH